MVRAATSTIEELPSVSDELGRRIDAFVASFEQIRKRHRWTGAALRRLSAVALAAVRRRSDETPEELESAARLMQQHHGFFPSLHASRRFVLSAILRASGEEPRRALKEMQRLAESFAARGFRRGDPGSVAAFILLLGGRGKSVGDEAIHKALAIWQKLRERRWFQSDGDDLPMAALLTGSAWDVDTIDERVERIYRSLVAARFGRGPSLQFAAHVLTLSRLTEDAIVRRFANVAAGLKRSRLAAGSDSHEEVAFLALLPGEEPSVVEGIERVHRALLARKGARGSTETAFSFASGLLLGSCLERGPLLGEALSVGLLHNAELILQAHAAGCAGFAFVHLAAAAS